MFRADLIATIAGIAAVTSVSVTGYVVVSSKWGSMPEIPQTAGAQVSDHVAQLDEVRLSLEQLGDTVLALQSQVAASEQVVVKQVGSGNDTDSKPEPLAAPMRYEKEVADVNPTNSLDEEIAHSAYMRDQFDNALASQDYDPNWASQVEDTVSQALTDGVLSSSELVGVQCQTTLCRLDLVHQNPVSEQRFLQEFFTSGNYGDAEAFYTREEQVDGQTAMTFYFTRDGYRLPAQPTM